MAVLMNLICQVFLLLLVPQTLLTESQTGSKKYVFKIYTSMNPSTPSIYNFGDNPEVLKKIPFSGQRQVFLLIHGWAVKDSEKLWPNKLKPELLKKYPESTVIVVAWDQFAGQNFFAAAKLDEPANCVASMLHDVINTFGLDLQQIHLIGHSLGAQLAGFIGKRFQEPKLGKITALEPVGFLFDGRQSDQRLDISDAEYVEQVVTNGGKIFRGRVGSAKPVGQVNIIINGGHIQPGCYKSFDPRLYRAWTCNHFRAFQTFIEYIVHEEACESIAFRCENRSKFKQGQCFSCINDGDCIRMASSLDYGVPHGANLGGSYYIDTAKRRPFCVGHLLVEVLVDNINSLSGKLQIKLSKEDGSVIKEEMSFFKDKSKSTLKKLILNPRPSSPIKSVVLKWEPKLFQPKRALDPSRFFQGVTVFRWKLDGYETVIDNLVFCAKSASKESKSFEACPNSDI